MRNPFESPGFDKLKRIFGAGAEKESKEEEKEKIITDPEEIKEGIEAAEQYAKGLRAMVVEGVNRLDPTADSRRAERFRVKMAGLMEECEEAEDFVNNFLQEEEIVEITEKKSTK